MSRPALRLLQPLGDSLEFAEGNFEESSLREIIDSIAVHSHLQLFLTWPEYSSACAKINNKMHTISVSVDLALSELDQIFLTIDAAAYEAINANPDALQRIYFEVFGITYGFFAKIAEISSEFSEATPSVAIAIPESLIRYSMRVSSRIKIDTEQKFLVCCSNQSFQAKLLDVSPNAFSLFSDVARETSTERVTVTINGHAFDAYLSATATGRLLLKPILTEPLHFGSYFDTYCRFAYPSLRSRYSFQEDPIPELMNRTGQAKKHAFKEVSPMWMQEIQSAYFAANDARHQFTADYVAVDKDEVPVGTSSLAKAYINPNGIQFWALHGVGVVQDPSLFDQTCMLYLWRADYILARDQTSPFVVWFDGRGRWLEKVYIKFQRLTSGITQITPVKHNRYTRTTTASTLIHTLDLPTWQHAKHVELGRFERFMFSDSSMALGLGVPSLNYSGILNNVIYWQSTPLTREQEVRLQQTIDALKPEKFFIETPIGHEDIHISGYDHLMIDATNRQCLSTAKALPYFSSSLEHSKAVVKKKYASM